MKTQTFGIEIETTGLGRRGTAEAIARFFGTTARCDHQFASFRQRVDVLLLEVNTDAHASEVSDRCEQGDRVAGKAADGLGDDPVDQAVLAVLDQLHEARAVVLCTGIGFICVDAGEDPIGVALDVFVVVTDLGGK